MRRSAWLLALLLTAPGAHARKHKPRVKGPPPARAEDDPRKKGDDKAFAGAAVSFDSPGDQAEVAEGDLRVELKVEGYALGKGPHLHLIVDNEPAFQLDDVATPLLLRGLVRGPHLLRAVLCRPWHEVVKAPRAFAMTRIWVGKRLTGKAGHAAEYVAWPDPHKPLLTYVLPVGKASEDFQLFRAPAEAAHPEDGGTPDADEPAAPPAEPQPIAPHAGAEKPLLDFYLSNAKIARRGSKIRVVLDKRELPLLTEWKPVHLRRAHPGAHKITIDLLDRRGLKVKNAVNRSDRAFTSGN